MNQHHFNDQRTSVKLFICSYSSTFNHRQIIKKFLAVLLFCFATYLPNRAYAQVPDGPSTLPLVKYHLTARPWNTLNISRNVYLDEVEGIVRRIEEFQKSNGAIIDPYAHSEKQYATPYFANAIATLISAGRAKDLLDAGILAMNKATKDIEKGALFIPDNHGEFFLAPLASAISLYEPFVAPTQIQTWKKRMDKPVNKVIRGRTHNWRTYGMKGEWLRALNGLVPKDKAVSWIEDSWINTQKSRLNNNLWNFYHDSTTSPDAWPYESAARGNLLTMIADSYDGASRNEILNILSKGTQYSLLMQDPSGQGVAGGRSGNHTWNDIVMANGYEIMAEIAFKQGNEQLAGQYRRAAELGFQSVKRWKRADGSFSVTKNHFDPQLRIGYANYSFYTNYNGYMMFHMSENFLRRKTDIPEQPAPNEIGGYTISSDASLSTAVANAGGMHMQVCLTGSTDIKHDRYWTTLGVVRFARPGWDSRLGPSDGIREASSRLGVSFAPTFLENDKWIRLASIPDRYEAVFSTQFTHPLLVRCRVDYMPKKGQAGPTFSNNFVITPDGILSTLTSSISNFGITWPILTFDGATQLNHNVGTHIASTSFPGETDQQNFIALHASPTITTTDAERRSSYGDLQPVRMISGTDSNSTFIYPRNANDPAAEDVRKSFSRSGDNFSSVLGTVKENIYIGRTSAGGEGTNIDLDNDSTAEATFDKTTGFLMQLKTGEITKLETDRVVKATVYGQTINLQPYTPVDIRNPQKPNITSVTASSDNGNVAANTLDKDFNTRWSASNDNQWIRYSFDTVQTIKTVKIAWFRGDERNYDFEIQTSLDSSNWTTVYSGQSSGKTSNLESYLIAPAQALYLRIVCFTNNINNWNAITEVGFIKDSEHALNASEITKAELKIKPQHQNRYSIYEMRKYIFNAP